MSNTKTIARNTGWYGIEIVIDAVAMLITSIAIARTLGPSKMGYIFYVTFIASVAGNLGGFGIPATTQKYMAEFLGMGDRGTARYIYFRTLYLQIGLATLATLGVVLWVLGNAKADYRLASLLIALSIWPSMVNSVSSLANVATEELSTNLPASLIATMVFFVGIVGTAVLHWGVVGVGASFLLMRLFDFLVRLVPTMKRILKWETTHAHPPDLRRRMIAFSWQSVTTMVVAMIVWDRSEFFLLHHFSSDIQIAYYSVAFGMAERLLIGASVFGGAASATVFAQYGRDKSKVAALTTSTFRYLALTSIPLHFISAALAFPALLFLYGKQYSGAAMVVTLAPLLCLPKAFIGTAQALLQSSERQSYIIFATILAGAVDIGVAWYLIPAHGAVGACIGSGTAQIAAVGMMWAVGIHLYSVKLPWSQVAKITLASTLAALSAHFIAMHLNPLGAILCGGTASLMVLLGLFYLMRVLEPQDRVRFRVLTGMLPKPISGPVDRMVSFLIRAEVSVAVPIND
jgi:O-antigen/teichoic acid export membrane protein